MIYGKRLLEVLQDDHEVHLILSHTSEQLIAYELGTTRAELEQSANHVYGEDELNNRSQVARSSLTP